MTENSTPSAAAEEPGTALVTGATGYIGGLLVPRLLDDGWTVRVLTRSSERLRGRDWIDRVEVGNAYVNRGITGAIVRRPVVITTDDGGETLAIRSMMYLALSYDHRVVDGADAARFLGTVKDRLEGGAFEV